MTEYQTKRMNLDEGREDATYPFVARSWDENALRRKYSACGKAIIVGEHAVVYGSQAVAMPLENLRVELSLCLKAEKKSNEMRFRDQVVSEQVAGIIDDTLELFEIPIRQGVRVEGASDIPLGAGLGSSAALSVAMLRAVSQCSRRDLSKTKLAQYANILERRFHGSPSGLDTSVVSMECPVLFSKGREPVSIGKDNIQGEWHFALIDSGIRASTSQMIEIAAPYFQGIRGAHRIQVFNELASHVVQGLREGNAPLVASSMTEAGERLAKAGVVPDGMTPILEACKSIGTLSSKVTGAGGGGCILSLLDPIRSVAQLQELKERYGADHVYGVSL